MRIFIGSILTILGAATLQAESATLWIGTSTGGESQGIYRAELDTESGKLTEPTLAAEIENPGFLALSPASDRLYSLCAEGVASFAIQDDGAALRELSRSAVGDGGTTHLAVDHEERMVFTAQYGAGSVAVFPIDENGHIGDRTQLIHHEGSGPNPARQQSPHPHWTGVSPDNQFLFVPDLGADRIFIYKINHETRQIERHGEGVAPAGAGPRHMKFHPNGAFIFALNELNLTVSTFAYSAENGAMKRISQAVSLPKRFREIPNKASEIRVHPSGKFVYTANRGHDSITAFRVNESTGKLSPIEREAIRGSWPRNFNLDPSGKWLVAAGRVSQSLSVFEINPDTGALKFAGHIVHCPDPICVEFQSQ